MALLGIFVSRDTIDRLEKSRPGLVQKKVWVKDATHRKGHYRNAWVRPGNDSAKGAMQPSLFDQPKEECRVEMSPDVQLMMAPNVDVGEALKEAKASVGKLKRDIRDGLVSEDAGKARLENLKERVDYWAGQMKPEEEKPDEIAREDAPVMEGMKFRSGDQVYTIHFVRRGKGRDIQALRADGSMKSAMTFYRTDKGMKLSALRTFFKLPLEGRSTNVKGLAAEVHKSILLSVRDGIFRAFGAR